MGFTLMAVTIYDVAKRAGVGIGTVSRALNDSPQILPETKKRVLKVVNELNYKPHALAQGLARRRTGTIAVIVPVFTTYFFVEMLKGIQHELSNHKYDLILYSIDDRTRINSFLRRTLDEKRVDGVLFCSLPISDKYADKFITTKLPIVLVDSCHPQLDSISTDNTNGARLATECLIGADHKRIGMINAHTTSLPAKQRLDGFRQALTAADLEIREEFILTPEFLDDETDGFTKKAGYLEMKQLLSPDRVERPTALFIASDIQAIGAIMALQEEKLAVPEDMAIVSYDDIELAEYFHLTTMRQPIYEMGVLAVKRLLEKITGDDTDVIVEKIESQLILRNSCQIKKNDDYFIYSRAK